jgi:hypothetical protein
MVKTAQRKKKMLGTTLHSAWESAEDDTKEAQRHAGPS